MAVMVKKGNSCCVWLGSNQLKSSTEQRKLHFRTLGLQHFSGEVCPMIALELCLVEKTIVKFNQSLVNVRMYRG
jgi:hypothetical protein